MHLSALAHSLLKLVFSVGSANDDQIKQDNGGNSGSGKADPAPSQM